MGGLLNLGGSFTPPLPRIFFLSSSSLLLTFPHRGVFGNEKNDFFLASSLTHLLPDSCFILFSLSRSSRALKNGICLLLWIAGTLRVGVSDTLRSLVEAV